MRRAAALWCCCLALTHGCGETPAGGESTGGQAQTGAASDQAVADSDASATSDATGPVRITGHFQDRRPPLQPWMESLAAFIDPKRDGWPSEVVAQRTHSILHAWLSSPRGSAPPGADTLTCSDLLGGRTEVLRDDALLLLERAAAPALDQPGAAALSTRLDALFASFAAHPALALEVLAVDKLAPNSWRTRVRCRFSGAAAQAQDRSEESPARLQLLGQWELTWDGPPAAMRPALKELVPLTFERALFRLPPFAALPAAEFGAGRHFLRDLGAGNLQAAGRRDRLHPDSFLGMHGLGVGDFDGNGTEDLYVAQAGGLPNRLYRRSAKADDQADELKLVAEEVAARSGVDFLDNTSGVLAEDLDSDGAVDLALAMGSDILLAWNNGDGKFTKRTLLKGDGTAEVYSLCVGDPDGDGDLDLYATRYVAGGINGGVPTPYHAAENGATNHFWRQDSPRAFADATAEVGLDANNTRFSLAAVFEDLDDDGDADLYVTNDFGLNNFYRNDGERFTDVALVTGTADMAAGMGITCADVNRDGHLDMYISNMFTDAGLRVTSQPAFRSQRPMAEAEEYTGHTAGNTLLLGEGAGQFRDATKSAGVGPGGWAWGSLLRDFDGDGWVDLYVPNGFITNRDSRDLASFFWRRVVNATPTSFPPTESYRRAWSTIQTLSLQRGYSWNGGEHNYIYWNTGEGIFSDVSAASGIDFDADSRAVAALDWDGDGREELALRSRTGPGLLMLHNNSAALANNTLNLRLETAGGGSQSETTVGTRVLVRTGETQLELRRRAGEGYLASSSPLLRCGLGSNQIAEEVSVTWPDGTRAVYRDLDSARLWILAPGAQPRPGPLLASGQTRQPAPQHTPPPAAPPQARVLLAERLPVGALPRQPLLPAGSEPGTWSDLATGDGPLLLVAWAAGDQPSSEFLAFLAAQDERTAQLGLKVVPLILDGPRLRPRAREQLEQLGLADQACSVDRRFKRLLELLTLEVLGPFDELPLPLVWLLDPAAQLTCIYLSPTGPLEWEQVLEDAGRARYLDGGSQGTEVLSGGRWLRPQRRSTKALAAILERLGEGQLSSFYLEFDRR
ncbi:MAG: CRTAC1 family protein [Planctomycetota bacterium]|nr:CRTAC1 family protein [Planctomycetota bacterium]